MIRAGDPTRFESEGAFARWNGTAPRAVSSGEGDGAPAWHRLDLGGCRAVNRALHIASVPQAGREFRAKEFLARKRSEGKTAREARRAHKRRLSNLVISRLWADHAARTISDQPRLAAAYKEASCCASVTSGGFQAVSCTVATARRRFAAERNFWQHPPGLAGAEASIISGCQWPLVSSADGTMHSTRLRPPFLGYGCKMPRMRRTVVLPVFLWLLAARPVVPRQTVERCRQFNQQRIVPGCEVSSDQGRQIGLVHGLRVALCWAPCPQGRRASTRASRASRPVPLSCLGRPRRQRLRLVQPLEVERRHGLVQREGRCPRHASHP